MNTALIAAATVIGLWFGLTAPTRSPVTPAVPAVSSSAAAPAPTSATGPIDVATSGPGGRRRGRP